MNRLDLSHVFSSWKVAYCSRGGYILVELGWRFTDKNVGVASKNLGSKLMDVLHFDLESALPSLLLARDVVAVESFISCLPQEKKFGPQDCDSVKYPAGPGLVQTRGFASSEKVVLFDTPLR